MLRDHVCFDLSAMQLTNTYGQLLPEYQWSYIASHVVIPSIKLKHTSFHFLCTPLVTIVFVAVVIAHWLWP